MTIVRQLEEKDYKDMMELLSLDPVINCYRISDLQNVGFGESYLNFYGVYKHNKLCSILMIYDTYGMVFPVDNTFDDAFIEVINNAPIKSLSGQDNTIRTLHHHFTDYPISPMRLACLDKTDSASSIRILKSYPLFQSLNTSTSY
ncbi:MAG: hypothetical protein ACOCU1_02715 [Bacillota bacterium]